MKEKYKQDISHFNQIKTKGQMPVFEYESSWKLF